MKIAISTISKNEEHNVKEFAEAGKEADLICVLDTGSEDSTVELLKRYGIYAGQEIIEPFRFDEARNRALDKLPDDVDIVVSVDMDERLQPGWREELEEIWTSENESLSYWFVQYKGDEVESEGWRTKIFNRKGYKWFNPVHEIPLPEDGRQPQVVQCRGVVVEHHQTGTRDYEPLLTKVIREEPKNAEPYMQRAHEWSKKGENSKAIKDLEKYIDLTRKEQDELVKGRRAYCYIDIAHNMSIMGYPPNVLLGYFLKAVAECPNLRESWVWLAEAYMSVGNYPGAYASAQNALLITNSGIHAKDPRCWGDYPQEIANNAFARISAGQIYASNNRR